MKNDHKLIRSNSNYNQIKFKSFENWYLCKLDHLEQLLLMNFHKLRRNIWVNNEKTLINQFLKDEKWL